MATNVLRFPSEQGFLDTRSGWHPACRTSVRKLGGGLLKWFLGRVVLFVCIAPVALIWP